MQRTISKQLAITYLDSCFDRCYSSIASMQLESYYTNDEPPLKICAITPATRKYAYQVGDTVNVEPKIIVNNAIMLTNIVRTNFLNNLIQEQR